MDDDDLPDERYLTAHHEAGHAAAALMCDDGELTRITIEPTSDYMGYTGYRVRPWDDQFATYAGPWAEARAQWTGDDDLYDDDEGCDFDYRVWAAFNRSRDGDLEKYQQLESGVTDGGMVFGAPTEVLAQLLGVSTADFVYRREQEWSDKLNQYWLVICEVAELLLAGCEDIAVITKTIKAAIDDDAD
jgi:hypothetical protein